RFPDRVILGCTHYELAADLFRDALPPGTVLIRQADATAQALERYFERHPEFETGAGGARRFLTTGAPGEQNGLVASCWGAPVQFEAASASETGAIRRARPPRPRPRGWRR